MKKNRFYAAAKSTIGPLLKLCMRIKVHNPDSEYKGEEGLIVCANHTHMFDCIVLGVAYMTRQVRFLAKKELFRIPLLKNVMEWLGAYGVDRGGADVGAVKKTISLLSAGETVGIFPQGTRHKGTPIALTQFKNGAAMTAYHAHVPVQPVLIKVKGYRYRLFCKKTVIFGEPITWEELGFAEGEHADYTKATQIIKERILSLEKIEVQE